MWSTVVWYFLAGSEQVCFQIYSNGLFGVIASGAAACERVSAEGAGGDGTEAGSCYRRAKGCCTRWREETGRFRGRRTCRCSGIQAQNVNARYLFYPRRPLSRQGAPPRPPALAPASRGRPNPAGGLRGLAAASGRAREGWIGWGGCHVRRRLWPLTINMESIFHERQEGSLCAQHCLNNLLQGEYFSPVELSSIAQQLDEEERMRMAEGGVSSEEYRTFLQWFNLNSLLMGPELISDTYLALFLAQLQQEGYSIFVVKGDLPDCEADQLLQMIRVQQIQRPKLIGEETAQSRDQRLPRSDVDQAIDVNHPFDGTGMLDEDEENFQKALALSRQEMDMEDEEADLRRAIQLSMQGSRRSEISGSLPQNVPQLPHTSQTDSLSSEELRRRRQAYFEKQQQQLQQQDRTQNLHNKPTLSSGTPEADPGGDMSEEDMLQAAMNMSLESVRNHLNTEEEK
ncbi:ataxin-3 isoform X4 [Strigops habroptila]|uniref:ataxin-3 isoform X4 n=1 Tax=Strigops habroptila TaxID=2489341 RepID=UPI0011CFE28C|nr:ataxin-3 isoform X4 [Strigops habroptila]